MTKKLEDSLGINSMPIVLNENYSRQVLTELDADVEEDVVTAKEHLINARDIALRAVQAMLDIADQSQDPSSYKVLNDLLKTYADTSMSTVDLQGKKQKLIRKKEGQPEEKGVTNNLFVGSTAELLQMISNKKLDTE